MVRSIMYKIKNHRDKWDLLHYYRRHKELLDDEKEDVIRYIKKHKLEVFNYEDYFPMRSILFRCFGEVWLSGKNR